MQRVSIDYFQLNVSMVFQILPKTLKPYQFAVCSTLISAVIEGVGEPLISVNNLSPGGCTMIHLMEESLESSDKYECPSQQYLYEAGTVHVCCEYFNIIKFNSPPSAS